jgi:hypothetical protein
VAQAAPLRARVEVVVLLPPPAWAGRRAVPLALPALAPPVRLAMLVVLVPLALFVLFAPDGRGRARSRRHVATRAARRGAAQAGLGVRKAAQQALRPAAPQRPLAEW